MINEPHYILPGEDGFKDTLLDVYLAAGYYRMQHMIFTTCRTQIDMEGEPLPVFWLRTVVKNIQDKKSGNIIDKKCKQFTVTIKTACVTDETEALYSLYRNHISFNAAATCYEYLHQNDFSNPFNSRMIEVRDGDGLIAAGFFDEGKDSIAGILNFYHPHYKRYSLGKYLMLQKIKYAAGNDIGFYYSGYLSTAISKFDYKLFPDTEAIEVFLPAVRQWVPYNLLGKAMLIEYYNRYHL